MSSLNTPKPNPPPILKKTVKTVGIDYKPHPAQLAFHNSKARYRIMAAGRKFGKTHMLTFEAFTWLGIPGAMVWWVAPYYSVAQIGYRRFVKLIPKITIRSIDKKNLMIEMINGAQLWFKSADSPDGLVGEGIDFLILDEAARVPDVVWYETLQPNLADPRRAGHMAAISTPRGKANWFYNYWLRGQSKDNRSVYESWGMDVHILPITNEIIEDFTGGLPSWVNPYFRLADLQEAMELPKRVILQEYASRFIEDLGLVFQGVLKARAGTFNEPDLLETYFVGVDLAKAQDYTVICVMNSKGHVDYLGRWNKRLWTTQVTDLIEIATRFNNATVLIDSTGLGDPIFDFMRSRYSNVQPLKLTNESKREIIENLAICIAGVRFTYPEAAEALVEELSVFGVEQSTSGAIKYEAPKGFHDDCVIAAALACWLHLRELSLELGYEYLGFDDEDESDLV